MNYAVLKEMLKRDEAVRLKPYDDATGKEFRQGDTLVGKLTLGTGRNLTDVGISDSENDFLLMSDVGRAEGGLDVHMPWWRQLDENRQMVLVNLAFNLGIQGLLGFQVMLGRIKAGDFAGAAEAMLDSKWSQQVKARATRLAAMMKGTT